MKCTHRVSIWGTGEHRIPSTLSILRMSITGYAERASIFFFSILSHVECYAGHQQSPRSASSISADNLADHRHLLRSAFYLCKDFADHRLRTRLTYPVRASVMLSWHQLGTTFPAQHASYSCKSPLRTASIAMLCVRRLCCYAQQRHNPCSAYSVCAGAMLGIDLMHAQHNQSVLVPWYYAEHPRPPCSAYSVCEGVVLSIHSRHAQHNTFVKVLCSASTSAMLSITRL